MHQAPEWVVCGYPPPPTAISLLYFVAKSSPKTLSTSWCRSKIRMAPSTTHNWSSPVRLHIKTSCFRNTIANTGPSHLSVTTPRLCPGATRAQGPTAYLLRLNSLHQRHFRYLSKADYLPGVYNRMADELSRLWHLSDSQLLLHFELHYPQPQPWRIVHLRSAMRSSLISALQMKRGDLQSVLHRLPIGPLGPSSVCPLG